MKLLSLPVELIIYLTSDKLQYLYVFPFWQAHWKKFLVVAYSCNFMNIWNKSVSLTLNLSRVLAIWFSKTSILLLFEINCGNLSWIPKIVEVLLFNFTIIFQLVTYVCTQSIRFIGNPIWPNLLQFNLLYFHPDGFDKSKRRDTTYCLSSSFWWMWFTR